MSDRTDFEDWNSEDDDLVRRALASLREDVDHLPVVPVETIKGRGGRRRRNTWLTAGIGLAAAAAAVGAVAVSGVLRPDATVTDPAWQSATILSTSPTPSTSATTPTTSPSSSATRNVDWAELLATKGLLPTAAEWQAALGSTAEPTVAESPAGIPELLCPTVTWGDGVAVTAQDVTLAQSDDVFAQQVTFIYADDLAAAAAANEMVKGFGACTVPGLTLTPESSDRYSDQPVMWSFRNTDGTQGWLTVTQRGRQISYLETWAERGTTALTLDQFARLTSIVENRLETYGESSTGTAGTDGVPDRHIAGPDGATPAADLFVDPREFVSKVFTDGADVEAGVGEWEGSPMVAIACDTDDATDGTFGLMKLKLTDRDNSFFATERVRRVTGSRDAAYTELTDSLANCTADAQGTTIEVTAGPEAGTYLLHLVDGDFQQYVAVTPTTTPGHLATIVLDVHDLNHPDGVDQGAAFTELLRLRDLAAAR